jgi:hypothetical protein
MTTTTFNASHVCLLLIKEVDTGSAWIKRNLYDVQIDDVGTVDIHVTREQENSKVWWTITDEDGKVHTCKSKDLMLDYVAFLMNHPTKEA